MLKTVETQTAAPAPLELATRHPDVVVRSLGPDDDEAYSELARQNAEHIQSGNLWHEEYERGDGIADLRAQEGVRRMGMWHKGKLVGGLDAVELPGGEVEVSYWLDDDHTGLGIAGASVRAITDFYNEQGIDVKAEVEPNNYLSRRLLGKLGFQLDSYDEDEGRDIFYHAAATQVASPEEDEETNPPSQTGHIHAA